MSKVKQSQAKPKKEIVIISNLKMIRKSNNIEERLLAASEVLELSPSQLARLAVGLLMSDPAETGEKFDVERVGALLGIPSADLKRVARSNGIKTDGYGSDIGVGDDLLTARV